MNMAVNDSGHDELSAEIGDLSLIIREAGLISHVDEFTVFNRKSRCQRIALICCEILAFLMI